MATVDSHESTINNKPMVQFIGVEEHYEPQSERFILEFRMNVDGKPYVKIEKIRHAEDVSARIITAKYMPEIIVKKI